MFDTVGCSLPTSQKHNTTDHDKSNKSNNRGSITTPKAKEDQVHTLLDGIKCSKPDNLARRTLNIAVDVLKKRPSMLPMRDPVGHSAV